MATANQKVAAAAKMAVHTMIRANGWSLVWSGSSLMSEGEACAKHGSNSREPRVNDLFMG